MPAILVDFHDLSIRLNSHDRRVKEHWLELFDFEIACGSKSFEQRESDIVLNIDVVESLPPAPPASPDYISDEPPLSVYFDNRQLPRVWLSRFGLLTWHLGTDQGQRNARADVLITEEFFNLFALDNITTLALAPLLRRQDFFVVHAFTAVRANEAVMFVGPSGSGKTSSGLALLASGWQLLANDMALMSGKERARAVLSPGSIQVSPLTPTFLPQYAPLLDKYAFQPAPAKVTVPRLNFLPDREAILSAPLKAIFFPSVTENEEHRAQPASKAVGLARLMEFSMDRWDRGKWDDHVAFLERLSRQVDFYWLQLGRSMANLAQFLAAEI